MPPISEPVTTLFRFTKKALQEAIATVVAGGYPQVEFCDTELPDFRLIAYKSGKATYTSRYRHQKRRDSMKLGDFRVLTLEQAREMHREVMYKLAHGENPKEARKAKITFAEFSIEFLALGEGRKKSHGDDVQKFEKRLNPAFGKMPLADVTTAMLNRFLHTLHTKDDLAGSTCNRYRTLLNTFFDRAIKMGYLPQGRNPMQPIRPYAESSGPADFMSKDAMAAFIAAADADENRHAAILFILLALTGARLSEWLKATWDRVSLERQQLRLSAADSKNGRAAVIFLSKAAVGYLEELHQARSNPYVFAGQRGNAIMSRPAKVFERIVKRAGLAGRGFTIHSLRHGFASCLANDGETPLWAVQSALRHQTQQMVQRYAHVHADTLRAANERMAELVFANRPITPSNLR